MVCCVRETAIETKVKYPAESTRMGPNSDVTKVVYNRVATVEAFTGTNLLCLGKEHGMSGPGRVNSLVVSGTDVVVGGKGLRLSEEHEKVGAVSLAHNAD